MKENKKNSKSTLVLIVLLIVVLLSFVVFNTFAKYTSSVSGEDTITAAKWSFKVNGNEIAIIGTEPTVNIDLFKTIKDSNGTADETDVVEKKIAPGTSGSFNLTVQNTSEVTAKYSIDLAITGADNIPLEYKVGDGAWSSSLSSVAASDSTKLAAGSDEVTIPVSWKWAFDGDDAKDTATGIAVREGTIGDITVTATITATQVD